MKLIQPVEVGVVREIHVRDGQRVRAGDPLVDLDPTESEVDLEQTRRVLEESRMEYAGADYGLRHLMGEAVSLERPEGVDEAVFEVQRERLASELRLLGARLAALDSEVERLRATRAGEAAQIAALEPLIEVVREHEQSLRELLDTGLGGRAPWFELRRERAERERELAGHRHRLRQLDAELASVARRHEETVAEFRYRAAANRVEALGRMEQARLELRSALLRTERNRLRAPVDGTVQQLSVHTVGGVVRSAEPLMVVVPHGVTLEVEANVLNRDIGFVEVAQPVEVKVEAFPLHPLRAHRWRGGAPVCRRGARRDPGAGVSDEGEARGRADSRQRPLGGPRSGDVGGGRSQDRQAPGHRVLSRAAAALPQRGVA